MDQVILIGAGGHAKEILGLIRDVQRVHRDFFAIQGVFADSKPQESNFSLHNIDYLGTIGDLIENSTRYLDSKYVIAIGDSDIREEIDFKLQEAGLSPLTLVHPTALIGEMVEIGEGSIICANAVLTTNIRIGRQSHINIGAIIHHDVIIGDFVTISPSVTVTGNCQIEKLATVYAGATLVPGIRIGSKAKVGAGSVVTKEVAAGVTVGGSPAREL